MAKQLTEVQKRLKALQGKWKAAKPKTGFQELPAGQYEGKIESAVVGVSQKSNRLQVIWKLSVTSGDCKGRTALRFSGIETEENFEWLKGDLVTLDIAEEELEDIDALNLPNILERVVGLPIIFKVRHKDEYTNYDFVDVLGEATEAEEAPEDEKAEEDDDGGNPVSYKIPETRADAKKLTEPQLKAIAADLDMDADKFKTAAALRIAVIDELGL